MAIRIPSKNIYSPINNPKVRDNAIDNITVGYNKVASLNEFDKVVHLDTQKITPSGYAGEPNQENLVTANITKGGYLYYYGFSYIRIERSYSEVTSKIPIIGNNYYVSSIVPHSQEDKTIGNFRVLGKTKTGLASAYILGESTTVGAPNFSVGGFDYGDEPTEEQGVLAIPKNGIDFQDSVTITYNDIERTANNTLKFVDTISDFSKISTKYITENGIDYLETTLTYLTRLRVTKLKGINDDLNIQTSSSTLINGDYVEYYPTDIEITFYGNTVGISVEDNTIVIGNASGSKPHKIDGNELMQNRHYLRDRYYKTILDYSNGKETATIRCEIDNYYDYDTNKVVIAPFNNQLLDSAKYNELWNATYKNGKVSQKSADTSATEETVAINNYTSSNNAYIKNFNDEKYREYSDGQSLTLTYYVDGEEKTLKGIVDLDESTGIRYFITPDNVWGLNLLYSDGTNKIWGAILLNTQINDYGGAVGVGTGAGILLSVVGDDTFTPPLISFKIKNSLAFYLQGYENYPTMVFETIKFVSSSGRISFAFKKTSSFNYIRFKLNGKTIDTGISYDVSALENGKTYCFSVDVNIDGGQGKIYWENMMLNIGARARPYDAYAEKMTFNMYDEVIPMIMNYNGEDIPLSNNADGTPKVFKVLGLTFSSKGKVFQELSLQEC